MKTHHFLTLTLLPFVLANAGCGNSWRDEQLLCSEGTVVFPERQEPYDRTEHPTVRIFGKDVVTIKDSASFSGEFNVCSENDTQISFDNDQCKAETPADHRTFGWINKLSGNMEVGTSNLGFHIVFVCKKTKKVVD